MASSLKEVISKVERFPVVLRKPLKNYFLGKAIPFVGRVGLEFLKTDYTHWVVKLRNKRRNANHLGQIHATAMLTLAETTGVFLMAYNLPVGRVPLVKRLEADFVKRSSGEITASANLSSDQISYIQNNEKGEIMIPVKMIDQEGNEPVLVKVIAAWVPKKIR